MRKNVSFSTYPDSSHRLLLDTNLLKERLKAGTLLYKKDFESFVKSHERLFTNYLRNTVRAGGVELEDALQAGLEKIWKQWKSWPSDTNQRLRFAKTVLRSAAIDAIRNERGRNYDRPRHLATDFNMLDAQPDYDGRDNIAGLTELKKALARAGGRGHDEGYAQRSVLLAAFAALNNLELDVLFRIGFDGQSRNEVADSLKIEPAKVRDTYFETRQILRKLIEHAGLVKLPRSEKQQLFSLLDGKLTGREQRLAHRHIEHCETCQKVIALEGQLVKSGRCIFVPLAGISAVAARKIAGAGLLSTIVSWGSGVSSFVENGLNLANISAAVVALSTLAPGWATQATTAGSIGAAAIPSTRVRAYTENHHKNREPNKVATPTDGTTVPSQPTLQGKEGNRPHPARRRPDPERSHQNSGRLPVGHGPAPIGGSGPANNTPVGDNPDPETPGGGQNNGDQTPMKQIPGGGITGDSPDQQLDPTPLPPALPES